MLYYLLNLLNPALLNCWNRGFLRLAIGKILRAQTQPTHEVFNLVITYNFSVEIKLGISLRKYIKKHVFCTIQTANLFIKILFRCKFKNHKEVLVCV